MTDTLPEGAFYQLPDHLTWEGVSDARRRWDIDPAAAPLACGPGVVAWGRLLPSNYAVTPCV